MNEDQEKMKKKFRKYKRIMTVIEGFLMVVPIMLIIVAVIIGLAVGFNGKDDKTNIFDTAINTEEGEELDWRTTTLEILNLKDDLENDENYQNAPVALQNLIVISTIIAGVIGYVLAIIVVDSLAKIFEEVEKEGTPFTEKNIMLLKRVHIISIILWVLGMAGVRKNTVGLVFILVISAFRSVFEYGYKLQKEADETL